MEAGKQTIGAKSKIDMFFLIYFFDKLKKEIKILGKDRIFLIDRTSELMHSFHLSKLYFKEIFYFQSIQKI